MDVFPTPKQLHRSSMRPRAAGLRLAACLACAASTIVITACGGGHSGATPSAPPPATGMPPTVPPMAPPSAPPAVPPSMPPAAPPTAPPAPPPATPPSAPPPVAALGSISVELPLRRLSRAQYLTSLQDAVRLALPSAGEPIALRIPEIAAAFPADQMINVTRERHGGFTRADQVMQQRHIDAAYTIGVAVGTELAGSGRIGALLGSCATDGLAGNDDACLRGFIQRFGRIALRAPLTSTQVDLYRRAAGSTPVAPAAVAQVIGLMLSSARFLYVVEQGAPAASEPRTPLTAHELAARMALHFWNGLPDADLNSAADSGQLLVDSVFAAQVARLATHPRAEAGVREFFAQWFRLHELAELDARVGEPVFDAFRAGYLPAADTRENAIAEIGDLVAHLWRTGGTLQEVLTDRRSFARSADIASIYGVPPWNGTAAPVEFPQPERSGLLTRVAFTASGSAITRPIMKGYRIRSALLCQVLPPPPADAMNAVVAISPAQTTREVVEQLTEQPGSSCAACHVSLLNPLGFVTENFDALGRLRTTQRLFDAQGRPVGERPVRTAVTVPNNGSAVPVADARQLTQAILASGEFERCFARQYFRFTFGREAAAPDVGVLADLEARARAGARLPELLARVALRPEFRTRDFR